MEAAEVRVGSKLDMTVVIGQKTAAWDLQGRTLIAAPTSAAVLLRSHFKSTGFQEKGIDISFLTN